MEFRIMDLIDKYLGEGMPYGNSPSLDSLKYKPQSKKITSKELADELVDTAKRLAKGMQQDITANIGWAIKRNDKKKVKELIDKYGEHLYGFTFEVMEWLRGRIK